MQLVCDLLASYPLSSLWFQKNDCADGICHYFIICLRSCEGPTCSSLHLDRHHVMRQTPYGPYFATLRPGQEYLLHCPLKASRKYIRPRSRFTRYDILLHFFVRYHIKNLTQRRGERPKCYRPVDVAVCCCLHIFKGNTHLA